MKLFITLVSFSCLCLFSIISSEWITSYCSDCATINFVPTLGNVACWTNETSPQACLQNNTYAYCTDYAKVDSCSCPNASALLYPDPYREQNYINCTNSIPTYLSCEAGQAFDPVISKCADCINTTFSFLKLNCTHYNVTTNCDSYLENCDSNEYYDEAAQGCIPKSEFDCSIHPSTGLYPDTKDCRIYHQCVNGEVKGGPFLCENNTVFNDATLFCDSNSESVSCDCQSIVPNYVNCEDRTRAYPTKNCKRYYQCTETIAGVYEPEVRECSTDYLFNPQLKECAPPILVPMCENGTLEIKF